jgi:replicative DNA helicase Mcm
MEKGFVTYDKGGKHLKFDARVRIMATANPKGDRFVGKLPDTIKKQLPFDPALMSRFHLVFLVKAHTDEEFKEIAKTIISEHSKELRKGDVAFIREYIEHAGKYDVKFDKELETRIMDFLDIVKKDQKRFIVEISPRLVQGIVNIAKACARMQLKDTVDKNDLNHALMILKESLYYHRDKKKK